jgi:capsular exopolysaccharide synthesis family protein
LRWWWLILLAALLAGASAWLLVRLRPPVYVVNGSLMVGTVTTERNPDTNQLSLGRGLALTYAKIAQDGSVVDNTKTALGLEELPEFSVHVEPDSQILAVTVSDEDPQRAYAVATELVNQIVLLSPGGQLLQNRDDFVQAQLSNLEASILQTEEEIGARQTDLSAALSAREIRQTEEQLAALQAKLATLQANYVGLLANTNSGSANTISVIDPPALPTQPVEDNALLLIALAALAGAALALAAAYLLEFLDDRLLDVEQVREVTGLVTLGAVPESAVEPGTSPLTILNAPYTHAAEAFRVLRTNLLFASVDRPLTVLQVTSATVEEGKSYVSANLAAAFALTGKRVILIDADLRKPTQHRIFGLVNNIGVTSALVGNIQSIDEILQETAVPSLQVITSGPLPPNPAELISSLRMRDFLAAVRPLCDLVVIDSPPVTVVSDSAMLATQADGVLVVFSAPTVRRDMARNTVGALRQVKAPVLGIALNRANSEKLGYYYTHNDSYGNHYYHGAYRKSPPAVSAPAGVRRARVVVGAGAVSGSSNGAGHGAANGAANGAAGSAANGAGETPASRSVNGTTMGVRPASRSPLMGGPRQRGAPAAPTAEVGATAVPSPEDGGQSVTQESGISADSRDLPGVHQTGVADGQETNEVKTTGSGERL